MSTQFARSHEENLGGKVWEGENTRRWSLGWFGADSSACNTGLKNKSANTCKESLGVGRSESVWKEKLPAHLGPRSLIMHLIHANSHWAAPAYNEPDRKLCAGPSACCLSNPTSCNYSDWNVSYSFHVTHEGMFMFGSHINQFVVEEHSHNWCLQHT